MCFNIPEGEGPFRFDHFLAIREFGEWNGIPCLNTGLFWHIDGLEDVGVVLYKRERGIRSSNCVASDFQETLYLVDERPVRLGDDR